MSIRDILVTGRTARLPGDIGVPMTSMPAKSKPKPPATGRICRHERGEKNKTELAYEEYLKTLKLVGEVTNWWFESVTFVLADRASYTPDYVVMYATGVVEIIEIKGGIVEDDAAAKFRVARGMFPWLTFKMLKKSKGGWKEVLKATKS